MGYKMLNEDGFKFLSIGNTISYILLLSKIYHLHCNKKVLKSEKKTSLKGYEKVIIDIF